MTFAPSASVQGLLQTGFQFLQQGRVEEAWNAFHEALRLDPNQALAHHMVGLIAMQSGQLEMGVESMRRSIALNPNDPVAYGNFANGLRDLGRTEEALGAYARALAMAPKFLDALNNRAILFGRLGRYEEALRDYDQALAIEPRGALLHNNRAEALRALGRFDEALVALDQAVAHDPRNADALYNRANLQAALGRLEPACRDYQAALALRPDYVEALVNLGNLLVDLDRQTEALDCYDRALALQGGLGAALSNRSNALRRLDRPAEALDSSERALAVDPGDPSAHTNRGAALLDLGEGEEAVASFDAAIASRPDLAPAFSNRANALRTLGRHAEALESCERAIRLDPAYADPLHNRATILAELCRHAEAVADYEASLKLQPDLADADVGAAASYLALGDFDRGWKHYEARYRMNGSNRFVSDRGFAQPYWRGAEPIAGRTLLLHSEQGLGDTLQFCRYAALAKAAGARVILEVEPPLVRVLSSLKGADLVLEKGAALPDFDLHASLMSLPLAFGTTLATVPAEIPYLHAEPAKAAAWAERLGERKAGEGGRPRVGLVWSGGFRPERPQLWNLNRRRNIPLELMAPLAAADVDIYSLQKGEPAESEFRDLVAKAWDGPAIIDLTAGLRDFSDTAALIQNLDLVIAVDTSTAHLAGALGKPVWLLNRFDSCWRWMTERDDSPWYPTLRLFRQESFGDWGPVVQAVVRELRDFRA
ncbi:MAG TPA: tetratricopeptide repeat protein [Caulobacteraceae bacterium]|jgi:hypothetical protein